MDINKITCKTTYDKEFFKQIASYRLKKTTNKIMTFIIMAIIIIGGISNIVKGKTFYGILLILISAVLIPLIVFAFPYWFQSKGYIKMLKKTGGIPYVHNISIEHNAIYVKDSLKQTVKYPYSKILGIDDEEKMIAITFEKASPIYLDKNNLSNSTQETIDFLNSRINLYK